MVKMESNGFRQQTNKINPNSKDMTRCLDVESQAHFLLNGI